MIVNILENHKGSDLVGAFVEGSNYRNGSLEARSYGRKIGISFDLPDVCSFVTSYDIRGGIMHMQYQFIDEICAFIQGYSFEHYHNALNLQVIVENLKLQMKDFYLL